MADIHEPDVRSYNMSRIRSKNTKGEIIVRSYLHKLGFRFRIHSKKLPGKPDIVLSKYRTVILVHGCFWHAHQNCKYFKFPTSRQEYWEPKLKKNSEKDIQHTKQLEELGWKVIVIWECRLKEECDQTLRTLIKSIKNPSPAIYSLRKVPKTYHH